MLHRDHIKLDGEWGPKIGVKLCAAILSKLQCKLFFSRPFSVCSCTSRSDNWSLGNCFVFVFINCRAEKLLSWVLVGHYFGLHCFTLFFGVFWKEKKKMRQKWSDIWFWRWTYHPGMFVLLPNWSHMAVLNFYSRGWVTFNHKSPL